ncbi:MAG TPA: YceI family protein [Anaerolineaceae bacterium]|nr:YceI family protein [Anaerolineaceae bacterium]HOD03949.1 YceI family protein [Anaerolineaceae bacterium]
MKTTVLLTILVLALAACTPAATAPVETLPTAALPAEITSPTATTPAATPTIPQPSPAAVEGQVRFVLIPAESQAGYSIDETFINQNNTLFTAVGVTSAITGELTLNYTDPTASQFGEFVVDISTLTSDSSRRDNAIRQNWLESNTYPLAVFTVTQVQNFPANPQEGQTIPFQLLGNLKIREVTLPITWDVSAMLQGDRLTGTATTNIMLVDFGIEPPSIAGILSVTDGALLTVNFVFERDSE